MQAQLQCMRAGPWLQISDSRATQGRVVCRQAAVREGDWRGISAKRIRNQLLDGRKREAPIAHPNTAACIQRNPLPSVSFCYSCVFLCFSFLYSPFISPLSLSLSLLLCGISLMHVCGCHRDLALSVSVLYSNNPF